MNDMKQQGSFRYRSLFWPVVLIGVGVIWLLGNLGFISPINLSSLFNLWPLLLIGIGLDILFGRSRPVIGVIIALGMVAIAAALIVAAPSLGLNTTPTVKHGTFREPLGNATTAKMDLSLSTTSTRINALEDSDKLINAELDYAGDIDFMVGGDQTKEVILRHRGTAGSWIMVPGDYRWDIGLSPRIPLDLKVDASTGSSDLNLSALKLKSLSIDASTGSMTVNLPATPQSYDVNIDGSTGSINLNAPSGAQMNLRLNMSTGSMTIDVPDDAGVQLRVEDDSMGSVSVPGSYTRTQKGDGDRGVWESPNFGSAARKITIAAKMSTGSLSVR